MERIYEPIPEFDRATALRELASGEVPRVTTALFAVAEHDPDLTFGLSVCTEFSANPDPTIRGTALLCIGSLARLHEAFPFEAVVPRVVAALKDPVLGVRADAGHALFDLLYFCTDGPYERQAAWDRLNSGYLGEALRALFAIGRHERDAVWAQSVFEAWARHPEEALRGQALLGFAAMAWEGRKVIEWERVLSLLTAAAEGDGYAAECARSAINSIELCRRAEDEE